MSAIKRFDLKKCVMVNCVVPVLADNPLAYNLVLVSLQLHDGMRDFEHVRLCRVESRR